MLRPSRNARCYMPLGGRQYHGVLLDALSILPLIGVGVRLVGESLQAEGSATLGMWT